MLCYTEGVRQYVKSQHIGDTERMAGGELATTLVLSHHPLTCCMTLIMTEKGVLPRPSYLPHLPASARWQQLVRTFPSPGATDPASLWPRFVVYRPDLGWAG